MANMILPSARTPTPFRALRDVLPRSKRGCKRPFEALCAYSLERHGWAWARALSLWSNRLVVAAATRKAIVLALGMFQVLSVAASGDQDCIGVSVPRPPQALFVALAQQTGVKARVKLVKAAPTTEHTSRGLIPNPIDQNPWAHWRSPMDMMRQG